MANPDPEREIRDMLSDDRHTWQYFHTNMDRRFEGIHGLVVSCATHGVILPDPPEPGDAGGVACMGRRRGHDRPGLR